MKKIDYLQNYIRINLGLKTPLYLVHFITNKCNLSCRHCFYWDKLNTPLKTPSLSQIQQLVESLQYPLETLVLTGGEPFLSQDLPAICRLYSKINKSRNIFIDTNGFLTEEIARTTQDILRFADSRIHIQLSLDGNKATHNYIRGNAAAFDSLMKTIKGLKELQKESNNLDIGIFIAISSYNYQQIEEMLGISGDLGINCAFDLVRGTGFSRFGPEMRFTAKPPDSSCVLPPTDEIKKLITRIERFYKANKKIDSPYSRYSLMIMREAERVLSGKKKSIDCLAGEGIAVIYPDAGVGFCELEAPVGNLSDAGFDLGRLLKQQEDKKTSKRRSKCACTHGCFLLLDILYHPFRLTRHKLLNLANT